MTTTRTIHYSSTSNSPQHLDRLPAATLLTIQRYLSCSSLNRLGWDAPVASFVLMLIHLHDTNHIYIDQLSFPFCPRERTNPFWPVWMRHFSWKNLPWLYLTSSVYQSRLEFLPRSPVFERTDKPLTHYLVRWSLNFRCRHKTEMLYRLVPTSFH